MPESDLGYLRSEVGHGSQRNAVSPNRTLTNTPCIRLQGSACGILNDPDQFGQELENRIDRDLADHHHRTGTDR